MANYKEIANKPSKPILLVGDIEKAVTNCDQISWDKVQLCDNVVEAVDIFSDMSFSAVFVVMSAGAVKFRLGLQALKTASRGAKVILLVQMKDEPAAINFVRSAQDQDALVDDYMICPVDFSCLIARVDLKAHVSNEVSLEDVTRSAILDGKGAGRDVLISERIRALEELATTDELTGLKNRRYLWEFARQVIERAKAKRDRVTLMVFDIDDFKHYNDVYTHMAGDEILKQAAILMRHSCRGHDVVGRIGGDEFAVIFWDDPRRTKSQADMERRLKQTDHPMEAMFIAQRFRRELSKAEFPSLGAEGKGVLTISGGLASFPRDGLTIEELFQKADIVLLEAKRSGKNRIYIVGQPDSDISEIK